MTIRELIDRLKTADDLDAEIYIVSKWQKDCDFVANSLKDPFYTEDGIFLDWYKEGELIVPGNTVQTSLIPNRKKNV